MSTTQLIDIIEPQEFTKYILENSATKTRLVQSGILIPNAQINTYLNAGSTSFNVPYWKDIIDGVEADIISDDPAQLSTPKKLSAFKQNVRKSFLHNSWSTMGLSAEIAGSNPLQAIQDRVIEYWNVQLQKRLVSSVNGLIASNIANNTGDMVNDISGGTGDAAQFSASAVIDTASTLGDSFEDVVAIAMHSKIYFQALKNDLIETLTDSSGKPFQTFRGLLVIVDDGLIPDAQGNYVTVLFGKGAFGYGLAQPQFSQGTSVEVVESAGNGGGQQILHSRVNLAVHPLGFTWVEGALNDDSPSITELSEASHWSRISSRKNVPLAFLVSK